MCLHLSFMWLALYGIMNISSFCRAIVSHNSEHLCSAAIAWNERNENSNQVAATFYERKLFKTALFSWTTYLLFCVFKCTCVEHSYQHFTLTVNPNKMEWKSEPYFCCCVHIYTIFIVCAGFTLLPRRRDEYMIFYLFVYFSSFSRHSRLGAWTKSKKKKMKRSILRWQW